MRALDLALKHETLPTHRRPQIRLRWLGTAGFEIASGSNVLLVDPFLTRPSLSRCLSGPLAPDPQLIRRYVHRADAIALGHTHFDHALDVPALVYQTGATVLGSASAMALCRSAGILRSQLRPIDARFEAPVKEWVGPFTLDFWPSAHSPLAAGRVPFPGDIGDCDGLPLAMHRYRCGPVWRIAIRAAGRTVVHMGSSALPEGPDATEPVDLLLLCVSGWHTSEDLPERVIQQLAPRTILLAHWDNFFRPLASPLRQLPGLRLSQLVRRLRNADPNVAIVTTRPLEDVWL